MLAVGLTGGIGSGKSTVARVFQELGAFVVDADQLARQAVAPGTAGEASIRHHFGDEVFDQQGRLDRRALGQRVFSDHEARRALESIVHPEVTRLAQQQRDAALARGARLFIYDVPLLFERDMASNFDRVVVVNASESVRKQRLLARDQLSAQEVQDRIASQLPLESKVQRADYVIDNNGSVEDSLRQAKTLFEELAAEGANL